jgi:hypothetical protein
MVVVAPCHRHQTILLPRTDKVQLVQYPPAAHFHFLAARQAQVPLVAAPLLPLRQPPRSLLRLRLFAQATTAGTTLTQAAPPTPSTAARTLLVRRTILRTVGWPNPTPSGRAWMNATSTLLALEHPLMARAAVFSARLPVRHVAWVLWQRTRCPVLLLATFRQSLSAPIG